MMPPPDSPDSPAECHGTGNADVSTPSARSSSGESANRPPQAAHAVGTATGSGRARPCSGTASATAVALAASAELTEPEFNLKLPYLAAPAMPLALPVVTSGLGSGDWPH